MKKIMIVLTATFFCLTVSHSNAELSLQDVLGRMAIDGDGSIDVTADMLSGTDGSYLSLTVTSSDVSAMAIELSALSTENLSGTYDRTNPKAKVQIFVGFDTFGFVKKSLVGPGVKFESKIFGDYLHTATGSKRYSIAAAL